MDLVDGKVTRRDGTVYKGKWEYSSELKKMKLVIEPSAPEVTPEGGASRNRTSASRGGGERRCGASGHRKRR